MRPHIRALKNLDEYEEELSIDASYPVRISEHDAVVLGSTMRTDYLAHPSWYNVKELAEGVKTSVIRRKAHHNRMNNHAIRAGTN